MKHKHTPAPWELKSNGWEGQYIFGLDDRVSGGKKRFIAEVSLDYDGAESNARLISAAPDMLAALQAIAQATDTEYYCGDDVLQMIEYDQAMEDVKAIIKRVLGEDK